MNEQLEVERLKRSIIDDYTKGYRIDSIIKSIGSNSLKKTERKQFVFDVIYDYLMLKKKEHKTFAN